MMDVTIKIMQGETLKELTMKGASSVSEASLIAGFFGQSVDCKNKIAEPVPPKAKPAPTKKEVPVRVEQPAAKPPEKQQDLDAMIDSALRSKKEVPKRLPLIGQEQRSSFSLAEAANIKKADEPEHWKTGIKEDSDGTKRYKCRYECECSYKTNVYIALEDDFVSCYECGEDMFVEPATAGSLNDGGVPARDGFGNFFVAGKLVRS